MAISGFQPQGMLQDLACWTLWVQVQGGSRQDTSKCPRSVCLFCTAAQVYPTHTCPPTTMGKTKAIQLRIAKNRLLHPWHLSPGCHPLATAWRRPPPLASAQEATRAGLPGLALPPAPIKSATKPLVAGQLGEEVLAPAPPQSLHPTHTRKPPPLPMASSVASAVATEGASPGPCNTLPKVVTGLLLSIPSLALDVNLFQVEATGEGEAWGQVRPF